MSKLNKSQREALSTQINAQRKAEIEERTKELFGPESDHYTMRRAYAKIHKLERKLKQFETLKAELDGYGVLLNSYNTAPQGTLFRAYCEEQDAAYQKAKLKAAQEINAKYADALAQVWLIEDAEEARIMLGLPEPPKKLTAEIQQIEA